MHFLNFISTNEETIFEINDLKKRKEANQLHKTFISKRNEVVDQISKLRKCQRYKPGIAVCLPSSRVYAISCKNVKLSCRYHKTIFPAMLVKKKTLREKKSIKQYPKGGAISKSTTLLKEWNRNTLPDFFANLVFYFAGNYEYKSFQEVPSLGKKIFNLDKYKTPHMRIQKTGSTKFQIN